MTKTINFQTTQGILNEIESTANDFINNGELNIADRRARNCDVAIKVHALEHMKERFQTIQREKQEKLDLLKEDTFDR
jgi:hypothetical protein